ncbi:E3 ubiquitin-protein ligase mib1 [Mactra antiquata]
MIKENTQIARPPPHELGIRVERPKFPQFAVCSKRSESFDTWPEHVPVSKDILVEAGLVYTGIGDSCRCYHCGGGLRNWESGDDPMKEHAKWYPKCPHLLLVKGQEFINKVRSGEPFEEEKPQQDIEPEKYDESLNSPAALSCIQMGYTNDIVQKAVDRFIIKNGHSNFKGVDLCQIIFDMEENPTDYNNINEANGNDEGDVNDSSEDLESLMEENHRLKENQVCKVCLDKKADVIFLPCGHMICCPQCAPAVMKCPICRKSINGRVKALFSTKRR